MWGEAGNSSQDLFQVGILLIAVICIPVMLFPKPCIEISRNKKIMKDHPLLEEEMDDERNGVNHSDDLSKQSPSKYSRHNELQFGAKEEPEHQHDSS